MGVCVCVCVYDTSTYTITVPRDLYYIFEYNDKFIVFTLFFSLEIYSVNICNRHEFQYRRRPLDFPFAFPFAFPPRLPRPRPRPSPLPRPRPFRCRRSPPRRCLA